MSYDSVDTLRGYEEKAARFAKYATGTALEYNALKLASEAGEVAGKVAKYVGHGKSFSRSGLAMELGDVLWHLTMLAHEIGYSIHGVANMNLDKLSGRQARGTIVGDGDDR